MQGTRCTVEVMKALEKGYQILQIHEVWRFPQKTTTLFKEYLDTFAKIKLEASGYPKNCVTDEQKQAYVNDILENQGIQLDPAKIAYNPGLRALAKLMLNSFWGKYVHGNVKIVKFIVSFVHFRQICPMLQFGENRTD